jgi:hypothetical protein
MTTQLRSRKIKGVFITALALTILLPVVHHHSSGLQEHDVANSIISSRQSFTRGGAHRALEFAQATPPPQFETTQSHSIEHSGAAESANRDNTGLAAKASHEEEGGEHEEVERPAPTHIAFESPEGRGRPDAGGEEEVIEEPGEGRGGVVYDERRDETSGAEKEEGETNGFVNQATDPPTKSPTFPPESLPTLAPSTAPTPAPDPSEEYERGLEALFSGKTWPSLHKLLSTTTPPRMPLAVNSDEYKQASAAASEGRRERLLGDASGDERALVALTRALKVGAINDTWDGANMLNSETTSRWNQARASLDGVQGGNFSFIELGCFSQSSVLSAKVALQYPQATVLAVDVCGGGELGALLRITEEEALRNLFIGSLDTSHSRHGSRSAGKTIAALRAVLLEEELRCDFMVVTALRDLANGLLPFELEALLSDVLTLCSDTFLPASLPDERFFSYWNDASELIDQSSSRIQGQYVASSTRLGAEQKHSSSTYSRYSSTTSTTSRTASTQVWKVSTSPITDPSAPLLRPPVFSPRFLLSAGLVDAQRFGLAANLAAIEGIGVSGNDNNRGISKYPAA